MLWWKVGRFARWGGSTCKTTGSEKMTEEQMVAAAGRVAKRLLGRGWMLATAESCTGGWVAKVITDLEGSSRWFERGFVTYTNESKLEMLGVDAATVAAHGAVSEQTAAEMAAGALANSRAHVSLSITGIAGPGGGSPTKPVGTVCFGWARAGRAPLTVTCHFTGDREAVRRQAVVRALEGVMDVTGE
jgi:nicotinamide-nucleotide amidase